jgi:hypothetical protein
MKEYYFSECQKITVQEIPEGNKTVYSVLFLERMGDRWVKLGPPDIFSNMGAVRFYYGLPEGSVFFNA